MTAAELATIKPGDLVQNIRTKRSMFVKRIRSDGRLVLEKKGQHIPAANPRFWRIVARLGLGVLA
jgi:hypothetical protein